MYKFSVDQVALKTVFFHKNNNIECHIECNMNTAGFGMLGSHGLNVIEDLQEYRVGV